MCVQDNYDIKEKNIDKSQHIIHKQMQSFIKYTKLSAVNEMLRSFDLENNHENL
jgi:hypothetical protein